MRARLLVSFLTIAFFTAPPQADASRSVYNKPFYDPASKSYFEVAGAENRRVNWNEANQLARSRTYKGAKGRLGAILSYETHSFLMLTFRPNAAVFTGLRYSCKSKKLYWSTGEIMEKSDFAAWQPEWDQSGNVACREGDMVVTYTAVEDGFRWIAKGAAKQHSYFLVQYPTGGP